MQAGVARRHDAAALRAVEFLEKLAALTPRPAINLILSHGVLAPHARWRPAVVAYGRLGDAATAPHEPMGRAEAERGGAARSRYWTWAALMRRAFDLDVLRCPRCAGPMELIATVDDPSVIHRILAHLALPAHGTTPNPRPWCFPRERPARTPLRAPVVKSPARRPGRSSARRRRRAMVSRTPRPAGRCRLTTPMDSGRIAARWQALSALCQAVRRRSCLGTGVMLPTIRTGGAVCLGS